jgi:hypothetical protein
MQTLKNIFGAFGAVLALAWDYIRAFWKWLSNGATFAEVLTACAILGLVWFGGLVLWACLA